LNPQHKADISIASVDVGFGGQSGPHATTQAKSALGHARAWALEMARKRALCAASVQLGHDLAAWARLRRHDCSPLPRTVLAVMDKYLAPSNKSCMADKATKERNHQ